MTTITKTEAAHNVVAAISDLDGAAKIRAEVLGNLKSRVADLEKWLDDNAASAAPWRYILCWSRYGLGVKFDGDKVSVVSVENATLVDRTCAKTAVNGSGERARLMQRRDAVWIALRNARETLAAFEIALAKQEG